MQRILRSSGFAAIAANTVTNARRYNTTEATEAAPAAAPSTSKPEEAKMRFRKAANTSTASPFRKVGNVLIVKCMDHPFKYQWEVSRMLRDLRIEFKGQVVIHPDIPQVRLKLWRARHVVSVDMVDTDSLKALLGVPNHIEFSDLRKQLPQHVGTSKRAAGNSYLRSRVDFMAYRRQRIKDIMHRDQQELKLLAEKKKLKEAMSA